MRLSGIALGNLKRRKGRAALLTAGLTVGVAMVVALMGITSAMKEDVEKKLDEYGANIIVSPGSKDLSLSYGGVAVTDALYEVGELKEEDLSLIRQIENRRNISVVAPKVIGSQKSGGRPYIIVGVDFPSEFRIKKWWQLEGAHAGMPGMPLSLEVSKGEILLGHAAARDLDAGAGGAVEFGGREFKVKGVLKENASQDDAAVFMDMAEAQRLLGKEGRVSLIEVSALCSECPIEDIVVQISAKLPNAKVSAVRQAMALRMETVGQFVAFSIAVSAVVISIGALVVFISMMSSVNERTKEIGLLRAVGFRKSHIVKVFLTEAFAVSLMSGILGWAIGSAAAALAPQAAAPQFDLKVLAFASALALFTGTASSLYPAVKASRLEPLEALRHI